jgi:hypothetical protein
MWYQTFDAAFWLTMAGIVSGLTGLALNSCLKSRCRLVRCLGTECVRDVELEDREALHGINSVHIV